MKAIKLNRQYSKDWILTKYMNTINFGYMNFGFASASKFYFGKSIKDLTRAEQVALLAIPKNPSKYNPYQSSESFQNRYNTLINYFHDNGLLKDNEYTMIKNEKLTWRKDHSQKLPYISDLIKKREKISAGDYNSGFSPLS